MAFTLLSLFGGALECLAPQQLMDVSLFRDVPDHQEALTDECGDLSLIIEIDQLQTSVDNQHIGRHFWNDLAKANNSTSTTILYECAAVNLPPTSCPLGQLTGLFADAVVVVGQQTVSKFNKDTNEAKPINICIAVYRISGHNADILLTLQRAASTSTAVDSQQQQLDQLVKCFITTASSLVIKNYSLFT
eukprot:GHVS01043171.1.p1 GENE.GHVS01043171.1~~GHVS01043171.1.p1  ORF type:complete len:190 (-),score=35.34 GHVS01043171.1:127-696(-)